MLKTVKRSAILLFFAALGSVNAAADGWQHLGPVQRVEKLKDGIELLAGKSRIRITQVHDGVLRVRAAKDGTFRKDFSWALVDDHLDFKEALSPVQIDDGKSETKMTAGRVVVLIKKSPLLITFADASGNVLLADEPTPPMPSTGPRLRPCKTMPPPQP